MKPAHKQMALKASLFMILAANVSWHAPKALQSANLASELGTARASVPARTSGNAPAIPATAPVVRVDPPKAGPKPDPAIGAVVIPTVESTEARTFCAVPVNVHFYQRTDSGNSYVYAEVTRKEARSPFLSVRIKGEYADVMNDRARQSNLMNFVRDHSVDKLKAEGEACDGSDRTAPSVVNQPTAPGTPDDGRDSDAERIARGIKNCTLDRDGHPLRNSLRYECNLHRLEQVSLDRSTDEDDDYPDVDENGRTIRRRHRHERASGIAQVQSILGPLEQSVKSLLLSSNEDRREDGEDRLDDLVAALETVRDTATDSNDERAMNKMIEGLQKAYPLGEKLDKAADQYANRLNDISDRMTDLQTSMAGANMYQQMAIRNQMSILQSQKMSLQQSMAQNQDIVRLRAYQQAGLISQSDLTDFASDYYSMIQGTGGLNTYATAPSDILSGRQAALDRSYGFQTPGVPTINYNSLGLQNPAIAGGQNSMFPSPMNYPQVSGYPVTTGFPQTGMPQSNLPMTLPANVPVSSSPMMSNGFHTTNAWPSTPGYYNPSVMTQPMMMSQPMRIM